jgi:hypothetical protein
MDVEIVDPLTDAEPAGWEYFRKNNNLVSAWSYAALRAAALASRHRWRLAAVRDGGEIVVLLCGALKDHGRRKTYAAVAPSRTPLYLDCCLPLSTMHGFAWSRLLPRASVRLLLRRAEQDLARSLPFTCSALIHRYVLPDRLDLFEGCLRSHLGGSTTSVLENRWGSMEDYLGSLPKKRRRKLAALYERNLRDGNLRVLGGVAQMDPLETARLAHLTKIKHAGRGVPEPPIAPAYFDHMNAAEDACYFGYESPDGNLLCFDLALRQGREVLYTTIFGSTQNRQARTSQLYFDLYLQGISYIIETGIGRIDFGAGLWEVKKSFGCGPVQNAVIVRPRPAASLGL